MREAGFKPKKCFVCGEVFIPKSGHQRFCSEECKNIYRSTYNAMFHDKKFPTSIYDDFLGASIVIRECELEQKPALSDKIMSEQILGDFGVDNSVPDFDTLRELNNWQREQIHKI